MWGLGRCCLFRSWTTRREDRVSFAAPISGGSQVSTTPGPSDMRPSSGTSIHKVPCKRRIKYNNIKNSNICKYALYITYD